MQQFYLFQTINKKITIHLYIQIKKYLHLYLQISQVPI